MIKKIKPIYIILLAIIYLYFSMHFLFSEKITLLITPFNKKDFINAFQNEKIENLNSITRVDIGIGWISGELVIFRRNKPIEYPRINAGINGDTLPYYYHLQDYVMEHGIYCSNIGKFLFLIFLIHLVIFLIFLLLKRVIKK